MFSDVLADTYVEIVDSIDKEYSYVDVYTPKEVIKMLAMMNYVRMLSDLRGVGGKLKYSEKKMRTIAMQQAKKDYTTQMSKKSRY